MGNIFGELWGGNCDENILYEKFSQYVLNNPYKPSYLTDQPQNLTITPYCTWNKFLSLVISVIGWSRTEVIMVRLLCICFSLSNLTILLNISGHSVLHILPRVFLSFLSYKCTFLRIASFTLVFFLIGLFLIFQKEH